MSYVNKLAYYRVLIDAYNAQETSKLPFNTKSRIKFCTFMTFQSVKKNSHLNETAAYVT